MSAGHVSRWYLNRSAWLWLMAVLCGLGAAWAVREHIGERVMQLEAAAQVPHVGIIVAAHDLAPGLRLAADHLAVRQVPAAWRTTEALVAQDFGRLEGQLLAHPVRRGDPVMTLHVKPISAASLSGRVATGRRAITMAVDQLNSMSGMLAAGDLIDLYVSFEYQRRPVTAPLLQGVSIMATGRQEAGSAAAVEAGADGHESAYSTVTLDVAPEDAVRLVAARQSGRLTAVLRHPSDRTLSPAAARGNLAALLGIQAPVPPRSRQVDVIYGNSSRRQSTTTAGAAQSLENGVSQRSGAFEAPLPDQVASAWQEVRDALLDAAAEPAWNDEEQQDDESNQQ